MRIDQILGNDPSEEILWDYTKHEQTETEYAKIGAAWIPSIMSALLGLTAFGAYCLTDGFLTALFSPVGMIGFLLSLPLIKRIAKFKKAKSHLECTRYMLTNKGIYVQTGKEYSEETLYIPLDKVNKVSALGSADSSDDSLGSVFVSYIKNSGMQVCNITNIPDFGSVMNLIQDSSEQRKAELEERKRLTGGISEAEKYREPTPLTGWRKKDDDTHSDALVELRTMLTLAKEQKLKKENPEEFASQMADTIASHAREEAAKKKVNPEEPAGLRGDPQAAFFGDVRSMIPSPGEEPTFLDPDAATDEELLAMLSDDSVSDLQTELFGADAKLSGAFPDPTVNPLPVFQEKTAPVFPQKTAPLFPDYQNSASPYALPQDQPAPWSEPAEPEMEPLFPDEQKDDNTDNFFFRSSL